MSDLRKILAGLAVLVLGGLFLVGCGGGGETEEHNVVVEGSSISETASVVDYSEPEKYDDSVRDNYVRGCEISIGESNSQISDAVAVCQCAYEKIVRGVEFENFKQLDDDLREDIEALSNIPNSDITIGQIRGYIRDCLENNGQTT